MCTKLLRVAVILLAMLLGNHGAGNIEGLDSRDGTLIGIDFTQIPQDILSIGLDPVSSTVLATVDRSDLLLISSLAVADGKRAYFQGVLTLGVGTLFEVDLDTGATLMVGDLEFPVTGLDYLNGRLYGVSTGGRVVAIDPHSAESELIGISPGSPAFLAMDIPEPRVSVLECNGTGAGGNSFTFHALRFEADAPFHGVTLRLEATTPGDYFFDAELRRSDGIAVTPERVVPGAAIGLPAEFSTQPYRPVTLDFGEVVVAGTETFTLKLTNISGPSGALVYETFGAGVEPCPGVEELDTLGPPPATVIGDPAGFRLLADPHGPAALLVCEMPGLRSGDHAHSRGVRFVSDADFRATELRFNSATVGSFTFDVELRRSDGFLGTPERVVSGLSVDTTDNLGVEPFRAVAVPFGNPLRVLGPESFTMKMINVSGTGTLLFETFGTGVAPCPGVQETAENNVAVPTERGDPAGFRLTTDRERWLPREACPNLGISAYNVLVRGVRFTAAQPFTAVELLMDGAAPGYHEFTTELRRSTGFVVAPERVVTGVGVDARGTPSVHPYTSVAHIDFGIEPVAPGTFTLRFAGLTGASSNLFYDAAPADCLSGAVQATLQNDVPNPTTLGYPGGFRLLYRPDTDQDGWSDFVDNCTEMANPMQRDSDADGIGNRCDGDFNNDCVTNAIDLGIMKANYFVPGDGVTDMNGDDITNVVDLGLLKLAFFAVPGPSAGPHLCD